MVQIPGGMKFVSPIGARRTVEKKVSERPLSLRGKAIGFLDNHKFSVKEFFEFLSAPLLEHFGASGVVYRRKPNTSEGAPFVDLMATECGAAVVAIGD